MEYAISMDATFLFLGTGASTGVPVIGCSCAVCASSSPYNKRLRPSALIRKGKKQLLIDPGPDFRQQALTHKLDRLDGTLLTHTHFDHIAGIDELRIYYLLQKKALPCLLSSETLKELKGRYGYLFEPVDPGGTLTAQLDLHLLPEDQGEIDFLGVKIGYFSYFQGSMKVTGYRIGDLAYIADIRSYEDSIFKMLIGIETLVISALRGEPTRTMFSLNEAVFFAQKIGAKRTLITHMNHELEYETVNRQLPAGIQLAYDGMEVAFGI
jgi:phosphoribosyl 1,2-cyclic phosphate phosphodiesterase